MTIEYYIDIVRFIDIALLLVVIMLFVKNWKRDQHVKIGIFYLVSIICYLLVSWKLVNGTVWIHFMAFGASSVPILFWYFSKSIFDDSYKIDRSQVLLYIGIGLLQYILFYCNYILYNENSNEWFIPIFNSASQTISLTFIVLGIAEAYRGRTIDLLESRIKFRSIFIFTTGLLITMTLIVELSFGQGDGASYLSFLQKIAIAIMLFAFFYFLAEFQSGFFFEKQKEISYKPEADTEIVEKLNTLISIDKIYLQEGMTIRKLSEQMNEHEYKVRRYINQHLGFRNFNDFLNSHRIQDACEVLLDKSKSKLTVLEIAYALGFSSIGPFNKAFKIHTGTTPTAYRKQD
jgi:AraC-like DNA-binding protein